MPAELREADDRDAREAARARAVTRIPRWYSPWAHLAAPPLVAVVVSSACWRMIHDLEAWQLWTVPVTWLVINLAEWWAHRYVMHRPRRGLLRELYEDHALMHHRVFVTEDMAIRSTREFQLVLVSFVAFTVLLATWFLPTFLLALLIHHNVAALLMFTTFAYFLSYEWLHLSYHLPPDGWLGRRAVIRWLRAQHALHHSASHMSRHNFNVTVPLGDWLLRTRAPAPDRGGSS